MPSEIPSHNHQTRKKTEATAKASSDSSEAIPTGRHVCPWISISTTETKWKNQAIPARWTHQRRQRTMPSSTAGNTDSAPAA